MNDSSKIHLMLVDDHPLILAGISAALKSKGNDIDIIGMADSAGEFYKLLETSIPDIVLLDIIMPNVSGVEVVKVLNQKYPEIKILMLSSESDEHVIFELLKLGIDGFISKSSPVRELLNAVMCVAKGGEYYGKDIARIIEAIEDNKNPSRSIFTDRELEIVDLCCEELMTQEIADKLNISVRTVDTHKTHIFHKLGIKSSIELVQYALKNHLISL